MYPTTIFYWLSSSSIIWALTSLISTKVYYLPLTFWGVLFAYVGFVIMKIYTIMYDKPHKYYPHYLSDFIDEIIQLHVWLFITIMVLMVFFVLSEFLAYFYGIRWPLKHAVMLVFRLFTIFLIIAYYIPSMWLKPYRKRHYGTSRAQTLCWGWILRNPWISARYTLFLLVIMFSAVKLYQLEVVFLFNPLMLFITDVIGFNLQLELSPISNPGSVLYNLFMLSAAFLLSNLCFYPTIWLMQKMADGLHPIRVKQL